MNNNAILIRPYITEKTTSLMEEKHYGFVVAKTANKIEIQKAIEARYPGVQVQEVRTMVVRGKRRRQFTRRGLRQGRTAGFKKAIVTLTRDSPEIDLFETV
ncbi:MAG: 50S ribosomal protein L23 [Bacteroidota bacterium]